MKLLILALTYLRQTFASRSVLLFTLLMPMLFTAVLGVTMEGLTTGDTAQEVLLVADEDHTPQSAALLHQLRSSPDLEVRPVPAEGIPVRVEADEALVGLIIPAGFGAALQRGASIELPFFRTGARLLEAQAVEATVHTALARVSGVYHTAALAHRVRTNLGLPSLDTDQTFEQATTLWDSATPLEVQIQTVTRLDTATQHIPLGKAQSAPGMLVMFVLFVTLGGGSTLLQERERGTLRRLLVMPLRKGTLVGGKLLGIYLTALVQMGILILFGAGIGVQWGQAPAALLAMLLAYAFAATSLGILVAAVARTSAQVDALSTVTVMALAALGGAWWPIEIVPSWMQTLAQALPTYWGMQGFQDIVVRGLGLEAVVPEVLALLGFGAAFLALGLWRFRWE